MPRALIWAVAAVLAAGALGAGLWVGLAQREGAPSASAAASLTRMPFKDLAGADVTLDRWRGQVVVVNFWATWCPPCREEIPGLIDVQRKQGPNGAQIVGIAIDSADKTREFATNVGINYPTVIGGMETIDLVRALGNKSGGLPFTVVLDRAGKVADTHLGLMTRRAGRSRDPGGRKLSGGFRRVSWHLGGQFRRSAANSPSMPKKTGRRKADGVSKQTRRILVLHGPNLNLLGTREPEHLRPRDAGRHRRAPRRHAAERGGAAFEAFQSNAEGALIERIHAAKARRNRRSSSSIRRPSPTPASRCATRWRRSASRSSKCTCPTCTPASRSGITPISPTSPSASIVGLGAAATSSRSTSRSSTSTTLPPAAGRRPREEGDQTWTCAS